MTIILQEKQGSHKTWITEVLPFKENQAEGEDQFII